MSILLETRDLELAYGAFHAVNGVNLKVEAGTIHTIIGPNGAGKTSLFHCLTGERQATAGAIHFDGRNLMRKPAHGRVGLGMARSFQLTSLFQNLSVRENLRLAAQGRDGARALNFWRRVDSKREHLEMADQVLERLQLTARADTLAGELSHGQQRVLEVGMSICSKPKLWMLDEPTSGMGFIAWPVAKGNTALLEYLSVFVNHLRDTGKLAELQKKWLGQAFDNLPREPITSVEQFKQLTAQ